MRKLKTDRDDLTVRYAGEGPMPKNLALWRNAFVAWRDALEKYSRISANEGWVWNERPQLGFLSTGIWNAGGVTIAEYGVEKQGYHDRRRKYPGRGDLWVNLGKASHAIEAKHNEVRIDTRGTQATISGLLNTAGWDSLRNVEDVHYRTAVCFVPLLSKSYVDEDVRRAFLDVQETGQIIQGMFDRGFRVDLFPNWAHDAERDDGARYVGIALLVGMDDV